MADSFWKALGSKLVQAGAAYAQQVRMVNELKQLSPKDAQASFTEYVQGLSSTARAGFAVTLAALANSERNTEAKQFIKSLRAMLANPTAALPIVPAAAPSPSAEPTQSLFDEDLHRVDNWRELGTKRDEVVNAYLRALHVDALEAFRINLEQMKLNCAANLKNHRENEVRIVGGRFIEDQINYRMLMMSTGRHNPDWLRRLQEFEGWERWLDELHQFVGLAVNRRRKAAAPPSAP